MNLQMAWKMWTVWFIHLGDRIEGKLTTFSAATTANGSHSCYQPLSHQCHYCRYPGAGLVTEKALKVGESVRVSASHVEKPELADQNF